MASVLLGVAQSGWRRRWLRWTVGVLAGLLALFALLGYFWLPGFAKSKLETELSQALHRPVSLQSIEVNPFALSATLKGLRIGDRADAQASGNEAAPALFTLDELYLRLSLASVAHRAPVLSRLRVVAPRLHVERVAENRYSVSDLLDEWLASPPAKPADAPESASETPRFAVTNIELAQGEIEFVDRPKATRQSLRDIQLGVPFVANFASDEKVWVQPRFFAHVNGAPFELAGEVLPFAEKRAASLSIRFQDFDLTRLVEYSPLPLNAKLLSAKLDSDLKLVFEQASGGSPLLTVSGDLALKEVDLLSGARDAAAPAHLLKLPRLAVKLAQADQAGAFTIDQVDVQAPEIALRRTKDGQLDWGALVKANSNEGAGLAPAKTTPPPATMPPPARRIAKLTVTAGRFSFRDEATKSPFVLDPFEISARDIDLAGAPVFALGVSGTVNKRGALRVEGTFGWAPLATQLQLDLREVDLVPLQGWVSDRVAAVLTRGTLSFAGDVKAQGSPLAIALAGKGRLANVSVLDAVNSADLLRWRTLDLGPMQIATRPLKVDVANLALTDFFARVILSPEGRLNLVDLYHPEEDAAAPAARPATTAPTAPGATEAAALPVHVGRITLAGGNVNFTDHFIKPNYRANLTELAGRIGPLQAGTPGEVEIRGAVDHTAPLQIAGRIDPFAAALALDLEAHAKGIDMPTFSPYSGKYVGYVIDKGKLSVDLKYHIENGELKAENNIFLDQLSLGEKIESPDALAIPVKLAIALLKNARGEIDLQLPISGSINDPQFSIGAIIVKVFVNLIVKAVTAPFALLGSLFGGGQDLSQIEFASGSAELAPEAEKRLEALSKALADRPGLKLDLTGQADPEADLEGLQRSGLERRLRAAKLAEEAKKGLAGGTLREVQLTAEERVKYVEATYRAQFPPQPDKNKDDKAPKKAPSTAEMEQALMASLPVGENELLELARRRAVHAQTWLVEKGAVSNERVYVLVPKVEATSAEGKHAMKVQFALK